MTTDQQPSEYQGILDVSAEDVLATGQDLARKNNEANAPVSGQPYVMQDGYPYAFGRISGYLWMAQDAIRSLERRLAASQMELAQRPACP
jgi:hypothetical protein